MTRVVLGRLKAYKICALCSLETIRPSVYNAHPITPGTRLRCPPLIVVPVVVNSTLLIYHSKPTRHYTRRPASRVHIHTYQSKPDTAHAHRINHVLLPVVAFFPRLWLLPRGARVAARVLVVSPVPAGRTRDVRRLRRVVWARPVRRRIGGAGKQGSDGLAEEACEEEVSLGVTQERVERRSWQGERGERREGCCAPLVGRDLDRRGEREGRHAGRTTNRTRFFSDSDPQDHRGHTAPHHFVGIRLIFVRSESAISCIDHCIHSQFFRPSRS